MGRDGQSRQQAVLGLTEIGVRIKEEREKDQAGGLPQGEPSTIRPIIETRQRLERKLEAR